MTENEAIEIIEEYKGLFPNARGESESLDIAITALGKQIPKKPHKNFEKFSGVWCSCGNYLGKGYFVDKPSYCPDCGHAIDWSDTD